MKDVKADGPVVNVNSQEDRRASGDSCVSCNVEMPMVVANTGPSMGRRGYIGYSGNSLVAVSLMLSDCKAVARTSSLPTNTDDGKYNEPRELAPSGSRPIVNLQCKLRLL